MYVCIHRAAPPLPIPTSRPLCRWHLPLAAVFMRAARPRPLPFAGRPSWPSTFAGVPPLLPLPRPLRGRPPFPPWHYVTYNGSPLSSQVAGFCTLGGAWAVKASPAPPIFDAQAW